VVCICSRLRLKGGRGETGWVLGEVQRRGLPASFYVSAGLWVIVAASAFDRIGEKGIKGTDVLTRIMDKIKERLERRFGCGYAPRSGGEPGRG
jgi:hypothetical protein